MAVLVIDLKTDFVAGTQFRWIEVSLVRRRRPKRPEVPFMDVVPAGRASYTAGRRVTEVAELPNGNYLLTVRLLDRRGAAVGFGTWIRRVTDRPEVATALIVR